MQSELRQPTTEPAMRVFEARLTERVGEWIAASDHDVDFISLEAHGSWPGTALPVGWWQCPPRGRPPFPGVWDEPGAVAFMNRHCWEVTTRLLSVVGKSLNEIHGTDYPPSYWRRMLAPWMFAVVSTTIDHRLACVATRAALPVTPFLVCSLDNPPRTAGEWWTAHGTTHHRHSFLSRLVLELGFPTIAVTCDPDCRHCCEASPATPSRRGGRSVLSRVLGRSPKATVGRLRTQGLPLLFGGRRGRRVLLLDCKLSPRQALALRGRVPGCRIESRVGALFGYGRPPDEPADMDIRASVATLPAHSDDEALIVRMLPHLLPLSVLETFSHTLGESQRLFGGPCAVVHAEYRWQEFQNDFLARCQMAGHQVAVAQHGGINGQLKVHGWSHLDNLDGTEFLSWGWTGPRVTPLPSARVARLLDRHRGGNDIPLIMGYSPRQFAPLFGYSSIRLGLLHSLASDTERFRAAIAEEGIRERVVVKEFPRPPAETARNATALMTRARVVVLTYFDTAFIEALAINAPTIAFWPADLYDTTDDTRRLLDEFRQVGVVYSDPESAAKALDRVYAHADAWWHDPSIQEIRSEFLELYGQSTNWASRWGSYLRAMTSSGPFA